MTFTAPDAKDHRAMLATRNDSDMFGVTGVDITPGDTADNSILLVRLNAAVAAEWPHNSAKYIKLHWFHLEVDIGSFSGEIYLGYVKEVDATNGTIYIIHSWDHPQGDINEIIDFGDRPWVCSPDYQKYAVSGDYTVLQNDTVYDLAVNATVPNAAVGDLVLIYDYAGAEVTRMDVGLKYTVV
ncbi:hypothetical protein KAR91_33980 [Candidatus Pacearchaeota archaeon]|nr:hypothetical protein [Candidatus Pacearchaeota archaeon]